MKYPVQKKNYLNVVIIISAVLFITAMLVRTFYERTLENYLLYPDTEEYFDAAIMLAKGRLHPLRLPVYPAFLLIISILTGKMIGTDSFVFAVVSVQRVISSLTVVVLFRTLLFMWQGVDTPDTLPLNKSSVYKPRVYIPAAIVSMFFALNPAIINWDFLILTESLTMFVIALLTWAYFKYLRTNNNIFLVASFSLSGLVMFIKPFYLFLPAVILINSIIPLLISNKTERKKMIALSATSIAVLMSILGWHVLLNGRQNGFYGITGVGGINSFGKVLQYEMYGLGPDGVLKERIIKETAENNGVEPDPLLFGLKYEYDKDNFVELSNYARLIIVKYPLKYVSKTIEYLFTDFGKEPVLVDYCTRTYTQREKAWPHKLFNIMGGSPSVNNFYIFYLLLLAYFIVNALFLRPRLSAARIFLISIITYQLMMSVAGAHGEYARLMVPVYFMIFAIAADIFVIIINSVPPKERISTEPEVLENAGSMHPKSGSGSGSESGSIESKSSLIPSAAGEESIATDHKAIPSGTSAEITD